MFKLSEILNVINNETDIQELNKTQWMLEFLNEAIAKRKEEIIIEKIKEIKFINEEVR